LPPNENIPALREVPKKKRGSRKLLVLLLLFFISVFAYLFFQSSLAKISAIDIQGNEVATSDQIGQASGLAVGQSFFLIDEEEAVSGIQTLGAVQEVTVTKKFPGKVTLIVKEYGKAAYRIGEGGGPEVILANGTVHPLPGNVFPSDRPILTGWTAGDELWNNLSRVLAGIPNELLTDVSEIKPFPNVFEDRIKLYTRSRFEVITRISLLSAKLPNLSYYTNEFKKKNGTTGILWLLEQDRGETFEQAASPGPS
jgi:cell division protein FtsQ